MTIDVVILLIYTENWLNKSAQTLDYVPQHFSIRHLCTVKRNIQSAAMIQFLSFISVGSTRFWCGRLGIKCEHFILTLIQLQNLFTPIADSFLNFVSI